MTQLTLEFDTLLKKLHLKPVFQPLISLIDKKIIAYQGLLYCAETDTLIDVAALFQQADANNALASFQDFYHATCLKRFEELSLSGKLILKHSLQCGSHSQPLSPDAVILDVMLPANHDHTALHVAAQAFIEQGFALAFLDTAECPGLWRLCATLKPRYLRVENYFVDGLTTDRVKHAVVKSTQAVASAIDCQLIAGNIADNDTLRAVKALGISLVQGGCHYDPHSETGIAIDNALFSINSAAAAELAIAHSSFAEKLSKTITPVSAQTPINAVMALFQADEALTILPLVDNGVASGLVFRDKFLSKLFSSRYGIELFGKQAIASFISDTPFCVEKHTALEQVSKQITGTVCADRAFVITDNGQYVGVATVLDLLEEMTHQQIQNAKHANPLTLLPGSVPINHYINQLIAEGTPFAVGYFDLDNFKPYNDVYGYNAGDGIIKAVADTLRQHVTAAIGTIGHIGGDDFIVIFTTPHWQANCQAILDSFEQLVPSFYNAADVETGGFYSEDRQGNKNFFQLLSLSTGLVGPDTTGRCQSHVDIADIASEAKKMAKKLPGNSLFINRRHIDSKPAAT